MQTTSLCPWEGGALCVREIRLLPLPEGAASATPPAGRGAERGRFLSWPGGLRRRLSARRYRVPPAAAGAGAGRTEPGQAGPGRAGPQGREAPSGLPAGASRRHGDAGRPERRIPAGRPSRTARGVSARTRAALRPPPTLAAGAAALPSAPVPSRAEGGRAVACGCGAEPGRSAPLCPARAAVPSAAPHLWLPAGPASDPNTEIPRVTRPPWWHCQGPSEAAGDGACCRACLAGNVWYRS